MTSTAAATVPDTASGVLAFARGRRVAADRAEADLLRAAVQWAVLHPAVTLDDAETFRLRGGGETGIPLAGPGAPLVAEFAVAEFAAAVGMGPESGKYYVGHALELCYRLPGLWAQVMAGELPSWKARRVADATISRGLSVEAAAHVDRHVAPVAHRIRPAQLDRLVTEAVGRFMPDEAEAERRAAAEGRHFTIDHEQVSFAGTSRVFGELDLADALDLDDAIRGIAGQLADLGSTESLDVRRSLAAGELARRQLTLDLTSAGPPSPSRTRPARRTVLYLHLSETALRGRDPIGRVDNTRSPITAEQIRTWCGHPDTHLTVTPVIDLAGHVHVDAYEVPDRIKERLALRDHTCVFPHCTRPARRLRPDQHSCDCDHVTPYDDAGPPAQTCTCRLAPLCRSHHRLKTHGGWSITVLEPGSYLWSTPHDHRYLRDHAGTVPLDPLIRH
jgi:hypothetical protein